jgi:hypothetical protein
MSCRSGMNRPLNEAKPDEPKSQAGAPTSAAQLRSQARCCCEKSAEAASKPVQQAQSGCGPCCA